MQRGHQARNCGPGHCPLRRPCGGRGGCLVVGNKVSPEDGRLVAQPAYGIRGGHADDALPGLRESH